MKITEYLSTPSIFFFDAGPSVRQVFGSLIGSLGLPDPGAALKAIMAREEAGSTVIAPGLALPHARIPGITTIKAALGICSSGINYSATEKAPVKIVMLFLGPADNMREHLMFLAGVSAVFQSKGLLDALTSLTTPKDVLAKLQKTEKSL
jgi:mannitol/fructose-specific phosphotransferase system IIA component (Ntr-type)